MRSDMRMIFEIVPFMVSVAAGIVSFPVFGMRLTVPVVRSETASGAHNRCSRYRQVGKHDVFRIKHGGHIYDY